MPVHCAVWSRRGVDNTKPKNAPGRTLDAKVRIVRHALALQMPHGTSLECVAYAANQLRNLSGRLSNDVMHSQIRGGFKRTRNFLSRERDTVRERICLVASRNEAGRVSKTGEKAIAGNANDYETYRESCEESGIPVTELLEESARGIVSHVYRVLRISTKYLVTF